MNPTFAVAAAGQSGIPWPPADRQPYALPNGNYDKVLPFAPPSKPDLLFARGDAWCVTIEGLPFVPQGSSVHPERCLTGFYNRWSSEWRTKIRRAHAAAGYTHIVLWLADMLCGPGAVTIQQLADLCRELRADGFWVVMWLGSKDYPQFIPPNSHVDVWRRILDPVFDALLPEGLVNHAVIGGEYDLWNIGDPNEDTPFQIAQYVVGRCAPVGCETYFHFSTERTFWGNVPGSWQGHKVDDRFDWTRLMCDLGVRGIHYQGDWSWGPNEFQGRTADSVGRLDPRWHFIQAEKDATAQFDGVPTGSPLPDQTDGCRNGYIGNCVTVANGAHTQGYLNGGYRPTGGFL